MAPRRYWASLDVMRGKRMLRSALLLSAAALTAPSSSSSSVGGWSSSRSDVSSWAINDSSSGESERAGEQLYSILTTAALCSAAAHPFRRRRVVYAIGPEKLSLARVERDYGHTITCYRQVSVSYQRVAINNAWTALPADGADQKVRLALAFLEGDGRHNG